MGEAVKLPFDDVDRIRPGSYLGWPAGFGPSYPTADINGPAAG
jgi:hypothetical protein